MTVTDFLTLALDFAYLGVLVIAVSEYRRRREPVGLAVVAVFVAVFVLFAFSGIGRILPDVGMITGSRAPLRRSSRCQSSRSTSSATSRRCPTWLMRASVGHRHPARPGH